MDEPEHDALDEVVATLYGAPLADFVATRTRLARGTGDRALAKEVAALRKPTLTAWLLNLLVREEPDVVTEVGELGARMRRAQADGDASTLRDARPERDAAVRRTVRAVHAIADREGRRLSQSAVDEVTATVVAALADERSHEALASGMLVRALSYSGFGEVEVDEAVAARARMRVVQGGAGEEEDEGGSPPSSEEGDQDDARSSSAVHQRATDREQAKEQARAKEREELEDLRRVAAQARVRLETAEAEVVSAEQQLAQVERELAEVSARAEAARAELGRRTGARDLAAKTYRRVRRVLPRDER